MNFKEIVLHADWKAKRIMIVNPNGADIVVTLDEPGGNILRITEEMLKQTKQKELSHVEQFEQWLSENFSNEQCIALYDDWGRGLTVMVGRLATSLGIEKTIAKEITHKAAKHRLLVSGWNSAWKVSEIILKERWKEKAKDMAKYLEDTPEQVPLQTQMDRLEARNKVMESIEESVEVAQTKQPIKKLKPVEVIEEKEEIEQFPSKARAAMEAQRKASEEQSKKTREATLGIVDERKSVRQINTEVYRSTGQKIPIQKVSKGLPVKSTPQAIAQKTITPRKIK